MPINLKAFRLRLPVNDDGKPTGKPAVIKSITPTTQAAPWFVQNKDGTIDFRCPTKGATTEGTNYARCECGENNTWNAKAGGTMEFELSINELPASGRISIGQIHAEKGEPFKLAIENGRFFCLDEETANGTPKRYELSPKLRKYKLGTKLKVKVWMNASKQGAEVTMDGVVSKAEWALTSWWKQASRQFFFKFPIYCTTDATGETAVTVHAFKVKHGGSDGERK